MFLKILEVKGKIKPLANFKSHNDHDCDVESGKRKKREKRIKKRGGMK